MIMNKLEDLIEKENLAIISCYDATFASMLANTEVDALLVGDSLGTRVKGESDILNVTMHEILYHTCAVKNGANSLPIISDMPIHSYDTKSAALINAKKIIEAGADGVKLEGGKERTVLKLKPHLSPIKAAVIPLKKNNEDLVKIASDLKNTLQKQNLGRIVLENSGNIGKSYRRHDEIGTPLCITVDFESIDDNSVTVRDRDTMNQERLNIEALPAYLIDIVNK